MRCFVGEPTGASGDKLGDDQAGEKEWLAALTYPFGQLTDPVRQSGFVDLVSQVFGAERRVEAGPHVVGHRPRVGPKIELSGLESDFAERVGEVGVMGLGLFESVEGGPSRTDQQPHPGYRQQAREEVALHLKRITRLVERINEYHPRSTATGMGGLLQAVFLLGVEFGDQPTHRPSQRMPRVRILLARPGRRVTRVRGELVQQLACRRQRGLTAQVHGRGHAVCRGDRVRVRLGDQTKFDQRASQLRVGEHCGATQQR